METSLYVKTSQVPTDELRAPWLCNLRFVVSQGGKRGTTTSGSVRSYRGTEEVSAEGERVE